jgi:peptidyl-tRNA hydrolase, PTH2 family
MKQVIIVRQDLKLSAGKMAAQVGHAVLGCYIKSDNKTLRQWMDGGAKKVVLACENKDELLKLKEKADRAGLVTSLITDAGHTEIAPGTITCLGIGPEEEGKIDTIAGSLKML